MLPFFDKILCPIDYDDNSLAALKVAAGLAREHDATLYVLHVVRTPFQPSEIPVEPRIPEWQSDADAELRQAVQEHLEGGVKHELLVRSGAPADAILEVERSLKPDSLIMAIHGRNGLGHRLLGSVTDRVVRESSCPVLTIRPAGT